MTNRFYHAEWIISEFTTSSPIASATAAVRGADQRFYQQTTFSWILSILSVSLLKTTDIAVRWCRYSLRQFLSVLSLIVASATVCHCIFEGTSAPPHSSGTMWSTT